MALQLMPRVKCAYTLQTLHNRIIFGTNTDLHMLFKSVFLLKCSTTAAASAVRCLSRPMHSDLVLAQHGSLTEANTTNGTDSIVVAIMNAIMPFQNGFRSKIPVADKTLSANETMIFKICYSCSSIFILLARSWAFVVSNSWRNWIPCHDFIQRSWFRAFFRHRWCGFCLC